jgi:hypothetical protein
MTDALGELERLSAFQMDLLERQAMRAALEGALRRLERLTLVMPR